MAASETDIVNDALARLGISPIMALSDASKQAQFSSRFYDQTRDEVLSSHAWNFAMKRAVLARLAQAPTFEWLYAYQLPTDHLRLVQLNGYETDTPEDTYAVEGNTLVTDADKAEIRYVARVTDVTLYPALFVEAFALKLASKLAAPLTGAKEVADTLMQEYEGAVAPKGRIVSAFQQKPKRRPAYLESDLVKSRW